MNTDIDTTVQTSRQYRHEPPDLSRPSVKTYLKSRVPTLKPPVTRLESPFKQLRNMNKENWLFFLVGFVFLRQISTLIFSLHGAEILLTSSPSALR